MHEASFEGKTTVTPEAEKNVYRTSNFRPVGQDQKIRTFCWPASDRGLESDFPNLLSAQHIGRYLIIGLWGKSDRLISDCLNSTKCFAKIKERP